MNQWSCRHQSGECYCDRLRVGCTPGRTGCILRGRVSFTYDEEGRPVPTSDWGVKKNHSRRAKKRSA